MKKLTIILSLIFTIEIHSQEDASPDVNQLEVAKEMIQQWIQTEKQLSDEQAMTSVIDRLGGVVEERGHDELVVGAGPLGPGRSLERVVPVVHREAAVGRGRRLEQLGEEPGGGHCVIVAPPTRRGSH